ncbi:hypothetical protein ABDI30_24390 [Paenibacillus cisolokensis]|uniref:hypothetical protein n=1 Tax=Paenibacillus cisolokensis TaxID=1658519 RepID=UPI003D286300
MMFKKIISTAFVTTLVLGVGIQAENLFADPNVNSSTQKTQVLETPLKDTTDTIVHVGSKSTTTAEQRLADLNSIERIYTKHGEFVRAYKQSFFEDSEIAREMEEIGFQTKQLVLEHGIFIRKDL